MDELLKEAWQAAQVADLAFDHNTVPKFAMALADAYVQAEARARMAEFERSNHCITAERIGDGVRGYRTNYDDNDPRHNWMLADFVTEVVGELR